MNQKPDTFIIEVTITIFIVAFVVMMYFTPSNIESHKGVCMHRYNIHGTEIIAETEEEALRTYKLRNQKKEEK